MAEVLEAYEFASKNSKYPWDTWLDGRVFKLKKGVDYEISSESMKAQIQTRVSTRHGDKKVKVAIEVNGNDEYVILQAMPHTRVGKSGAKEGEKVRLINIDDLLIQEVAEG